MNKSAQRQLQEVLGFIDNPSIHMTTLRRIVGSYDGNFSVDIESLGDINSTQNNASTNAIITDKKTDNEWIGSYRRYLSIFGLVLLW